MVKTMSRSGPTRTELLEWLKGGGLVLLTIIGLFFYAFLSVPAIIFYDRFGVSSTEVGLTYTNLLSGSTAEIIVVLVALTWAFLAVAFALAFIGLFIRLYPIVSKFRSITRGRPSWQLSDEEYEQFVALAKDIYTRIPEYKNTLSRLRTSFADIEARQRRLRELRRRHQLTDEETAEKDALLAEARAQSTSFSSMVWFSTKQWIRRRGRALAIFFFTITVVIVLPAVAFAQAGQVLAGREYFGSSFGIFAYHATPVRVSPLASVTANSARSFDDKALFLLGQNTQYSILYAPATRSTIRIPVSTVIITGADG
jgi:ABC-type multidrug transport system fused ATPase/permease subunit